MNEILNKTAEIFEQSTELLKQPELKNAISGFLGWISKTIFTNKKKTQEKIELLQKQKANAQTVIELKANLEFMIENNEDLQKELSEKIKIIDVLLSQHSKTNNSQISGAKNKSYEDINDSKISDNSKEIHQTGNGKNVLIDGNLDIKGNFNI